MELYKKDLRLCVGNYDTFAIPIVIKKHVPLTTEKYVFTIRRVLEGNHRMGKPVMKGEIVFQKTVEYADVIPIRDETDTVVGCYFFVCATKDETSRIPCGINTYDLSIIDPTAGMEIELIPPNDFVAGEVLRYE